MKIQFLRLSSTLRAYVGVTALIHFLVLAAVGTYLGLSIELTHWEFGEWLWIGAIGIATFFGATMLYGNRVAPFLFIAFHWAHGWYVYDLLRPHFRGELEFFSFLPSIILTLIYFFYLGEIRKPYYFPFCRWYQGALRPVPGLKAVIYYKDKKTHELQLAVNRVDWNSLFVFASPGQTVSTVPSCGARMDIRFRDTSIKQDIEVLSRSNALNGLGVLVRSHSADRRKQMSDLLEHLRGEGYVTL